VLLDVFGTAGTVRTLAAFSIVFVLLGVVMSRRQARGSAGASVGAVGWAVAGLLVALVGLPDASKLWARLHGALPEYLVFKEDATGLSAIRIEGGANPLTTVFVNGLGQSTMPYGGIHTMLGMLPAFVHPRPQRIAIIGLGSGDTVYGAAGRQEVEALDSIEIIAPQVATLDMLAGRLPYGGVLGLLADTRIVHREGDGRRFLMRAPRQFDVIEADALRPTSAYSGNLYSEEYFTLVRERLRPNGLAATWSPTARVHNAFVRVFPHVVSVPGILLGSRDPIRVDRHEIAARLADAHVRSHYDRAGIDAEALMAEYLKAPAVYGPDFDRRSLTDFNTDLFPKDEFELRPAK
jgi:spermidine synthase